MDESHLFFKANHETNAYEIIQKVIMVKINFLFMHSYGKAFLTNSKPLSYLINKLLHILCNHISPYLNNILISNSIQ